MKKNPKKFRDDKKLLEASLRRIKTSNILKVNKKKILAFDKECELEDLSASRRLFYAIWLLQIGNLTNKPFTKTNKDDIRRLLQKLRKKEYSQWTMRNIRVAIKTFYKWLSGKDYCPKHVDWLRTSMPKNAKKLPDELLSFEDVKKLIAVTDNPRDKALLMVLYESGCRIGELGTLKLKNIQFDQYGAIIIVNGKTGSRRVRLVASAPDLATWMDNHPRKNNPDAPLWVCIGTKNKGQTLTYNGVYGILYKLAKKCGFKKRFNPHLFRHSRATELANQLTEAQLKELFGWTQSSKMAATYVHLSGRNVDEAILRINGIKIAEAEREDDKKLRIRKCPRCKNSNSPLSDFCSKCGMVLDVKTAMELEEVRKSSDNVVDMTLNKNDVQLKKLRPLVYEVMKEIMRKEGMLKTVSQ